MSKLIYFRKTSGDYAGVTDQINHSISKHLPKSSWTSNRYLARLPQRFRLSFGLFVRDRVHVLMSHGVADKNYLTMRGQDQECFINRLDHLLVPGPWMREKLLSNSTVRLKGDQITCVGWPRLDALLDMQMAYQPVKTNRPKLLWAPTHDFRKRGKEQTSTSSYPEFAQEFEVLGKHYETDISLHPRNRESKTPTSVQLINSDIVISDFGTMVYEAWALGKPVIFPSWLIADRICEFLPGSAEAHIFEMKIGYHPQSAAELREIIESGPVITPDVTAFLEAYLPSEFAGCSGRKIADTLMRLSGRDTSSA